MEKRTQFFRQEMNVKRQLVGLHMMGMLWLITPLYAQHESPPVAVFNTPIATTVEEAVKQQIIEGRCLPSRYKTLLFSLTEPVELECGSEVAATKIVGRHLTFRPLPDWTREEVAMLVQEACLRIPYSGWREHAEMIAEKTSLYWAEFVAADDKKWRRRVIATPFYKFVVSMQKGEFVIYSITTGFEELAEELQEELSSRYGSLKPRGNKIAELIAAREALRGVEVAKESPCEAWFRSRLENAMYHRSAISDGDSRWPTIVHVRFAASLDQWSMVVGERSAAGPASTALGDAVAATLARIVDADDKDAPREMFGSSKNSSKGNNDAQRAAVFKNLALLWTAKTVDGMDRIEVQFRCRSSE